MADDQKDTTALEKAITGQTSYLRRLASYAARREWRDLLARIPDERRLEHFGRKVYSQNDEDGIIAEIFRRLGITAQSGIFAECAAGTGLQNNTFYLLRQGFHGIWIEGSPQRAKKIRKAFAPQLESGQLAAFEQFVDAAMIDAFLAGAVANRPVALLALDIDGNDYWLWEAIDSFSAAVVVIEYNARMPPPHAEVQEYRPDYVWDGSDYFGATLSAVATLGARKGYELVGCNITGANAFFVRRDLVGDHFPYDRSPEALYHPARYELSYDCFGRAGYEPAMGRYIGV